MLRRLKQLFLLGGDVVLLYLALYLALLIRHWAGFRLTIFIKLLPLFSVIFLLWLIVFFISGLYSLSRIWNTASMLGSFVRAMLVNTVVAISFFYFAPYFNLTPKTILFLDLAIFCLLFAVWRVLSSKLLRAIKAEINVILVDVDDASLELAKNVLAHPELGCNVVSMFNLNGGKTPKWLRESGILVGENLSQLKKLIGQGKIDAVVVSNEVYADIFSDLYKLIPSGVDFYNLTSFWANLYRSIPISVTNEIWFLENLRDVKKSFYEARKRVFDIIGALLLLPFALLLSPFIVLGICLSGPPGPIFYRQERVGKDGKPYEMIKFRTMVPNAEKGKAQWAKENDPRVTKFGKILRLTRLDELPQLLNVLKGDMSFIGPRPERPEFVKDLVEEIPHYSLRHLIRPGLTGWAQINYPYGASEEDAAMKLRYDLYYLQHRSLVLDAEIVLKTIGVMLRRAGR